MSRNIKVYIDKNSNKNGQNYKVAIPLIAAVAVIVISLTIFFFSSVSENDKTITSASVITRRRDFRLENMLCETLSSDAVRDGWKYYYAETSDSGARLKDWVPAANKIPVELGIDFTNLSKESSELPKRVGCRFIYDEGTEINAAVMQENPGQTAKSGEKCRSTAAVPVNPEEKVRLWFMADIPEQAVDSDKPLTAVITVDDRQYNINLRENMRIFRGA